MKTEKTKLKPLPPRKKEEPARGKAVLWCGVHGDVKHRFVAGKRVCLACETVAAYMREYYPGFELRAKGENSLDKYPLQRGFVMLAEITKASDNRHVDVRVLRVEGGVTEERRVSVLVDTKALAKRVAIYALWCLRPYYAATSKSNFYTRTEHWRVPGVVSDRKNGRGTVSEPLKFTVHPEPVM